MTTPGPAPGPPPRVLPREEWPLVLGFAGVWLVFLLTAISFAALRLADEGDAAGLALLLGTTAAFVLVYLTAFLAPRPVPAWPHAGCTLAYSVLLAALGAIMAIPVGPLTVNVIPYIAAVWVFTHSRRTALRAGAAIGLAGIVLAWFVLPPGERVGPVLGLVIAITVILVVRVTTDREESLTAVQHALDLSQQREQLARDVHDVVGHSLTAVHVKAQLLRRLIDLDPGRARAEADEIIALTRGALGEVRSTVDGLAAPEFGPELARARRTLADAGVRLDAPSPDDVAALPTASADLFAWILREAVTNVIRHAGARRVRVTVAPERFTVLDDGVGPDADSASAAETGRRIGQGIPSMRARVERAGGTLELSPARPGSERPGTLLEVTL